MGDQAQYQLTEREHKRKVQEKLRLELEQQIRNNKLKKQLEKTRDVYHGLKVLDSYKTQSLWTRGYQDPNPQLRQSMPDANHYNYGYNEDPQPNGNYNHSQSVPKFETSQNHQHQNPQGTSEQIFQKTGNSILNRNHTPPHAPHPQIHVSNPLQDNNPHLVIPGNPQNATGSNFMADRTSGGFYDSDQLIEDNLEYLYHDSDHEQNRQANKYYNTAEDSLKPIMGLVEDPAHNDEMMRLRKYQKHQAQAKALLDQIEEKKLQKEWEKQQKKLEDERDDLKWRLEVEEENELHQKSLQSALGQNHLEKEALDLLHKDTKSVRFKGQQSGENSVIEKLQKDALKSSIEILGAKFRQEVELMKEDVYNKNREMAHEMQALKDQATKFELEKDKIAMDMTIMNRDIFNQEQSNEDQLMYLYMALSKTNPGQQPAKRQPSEYQKNVPLDLVHRGTKGDPFMRDDELKWDSQRYMPFNRDTEYDIMMVNLANQKRLTNFDRLEDQCCGFNNPTDALSTAMDEFYFNEKFRGNEHSRKIDAAFGAERNLLTDIRGLISDIKTYT